MEQEAKFLGVYNFKTQPGSKWHVWKKNDGSYLVQELLASGRNSAVQTVRAADFERSFAVISSVFNNFDMQNAEASVDDDLDDLGDFSSFFAKQSAKLGEGNATPDTMPDAAPKASSTFASILEDEQLFEPADKNTNPTYAKNHLWGTELGGESKGSFSPSAKKRAAPDASKPSAPKPAQPKAEANASSFAGRSQSLERTVDVEEKLRSDFSLALVRLASNRTAAIAAINGILDSSMPLTEEQKFVFSEFGVALRKRNLYTLATRCHEKAHELSPYDEHILFNLARVWYDAGKPVKAKECLTKALSIAPGFRAGQAFLDYLRQK